ncbi:MAG: hypothetical protein ACOVP4_10720 [Bacteriovoracaceae bacterium]
MVWNLLINILLLTPTIALSQQIITDSTTLKDAIHKSNSNDTFRDYLLFKEKIYSFELGTPQTPFYIQGTVPKRFYRKGKKCFEVSFYEDFNIAKKLKCRSKAKELYFEEFPGFRIVDETESPFYGLSGFSIEKSSTDFYLQAYLHQYSTYSMDRSIYGDYADLMAPKQKFNVKVLSDSFVSLQNNQLKIVQEMSVSVSNIGILTGRKVKLRNEIKLNQSGVLLTNDKGIFLIYNPSTSLINKGVRIDLRESYIKNLKHLSDESLKRPVCFRDSPTSPSYQDCHRLIFDKKPISTREEVNLTIVDFNKKTVDFILKD